MQCCQKRIFQLRLVGIIGFCCHEGFRDDIGTLLVGRAFKLEHDLLRARSRLGFGKAVHGLVLLEPLKHLVYATHGKWIVSAWKALILTLDQMDVGVGELCSRFLP